MTVRPNIDGKLNGETFRQYYYLKEELVRFCKNNGLPVSGGKAELTDRVAYFLNTGKILQANSKRKTSNVVGEITEETEIEQNVVFSEKHRAFFKERLGKGFSFNVPFQKWLKSNAGKTYKEAVDAYRTILNEKKTQKTTIGKQFEYNAYIRDFFEDNKGKSLEDAIKCWKYKKSLPGHNRYEPTDLVAINEENGKRFREHIRTFRVTHNNKIRTVLFKDGPCALSGRF